MILIVDDNKKYISRIKELLVDAGNNDQIAEANDYDMAIKKFDQINPSIILLDMNMPGKSGIEVLRYIKDSGHNCKVIMVTNYTNDSYRKLCLEVGADHFLDKTREYNLIPSLVNQFMYQ